MSSASLQWLELVHQDEQCVWSDHHWSMLPELLSYDRRSTGLPQNKILWWWPSSYIMSEWYYYWVALLSSFVGTYLCRFCRIWHISFILFSLNSWTPRGTCMKSMQSKEFSSYMLNIPLLIWWTTTYDDFIEQTLEECKTISQIWNYNRLVSGYTKAKTWQILDINIMVCCIKMFAKLKRIVTTTSWSNNREMICKVVHDTITRNPWFH